MCENVIFFAITINTVYSMLFFVITINTVYSMLFFVITINTVYSMSGEDEVVYHLTPV